MKLLQIRKVRLDMSPNSATPTGSTAVGGLTATSVWYTPNADGLQMLSPIESDGNEPILSGDRSAGMN
jgi:hypothetical protein